VIKFIFKWLLRFLILGVVLIIIFFLSFNSILRLLIEHNIYTQTGMEAEIGKFHLGLATPVIEIKDFKLYNPPAFAGTPFLKIPEIRVEYDPKALAHRELHITLLRFNLGEVDIVKNEKGETNIFSLGLALPTKDSLAKNHDLDDFKKRTGFNFKGIDVLDVSVGTAKFIDLKHPNNNRSQRIDIENWPVRNIKNPADLSGLVLFIYLRSDNFFNSLASPATFN
jgi:hypothetical protein